MSLLLCPSCEGRAKIKRIDTGWFLIKHSRKHPDCKIPDFVDTHERREVLEEKWNNGDYVKQWGAHENLAHELDYTLGLANKNRKSSKQAHRARSKASGVASGI